MSRPLDKARPAPPVRPFYGQVVAASSSSQDLLEQEAGAPTHSLLRTHTPPSPSAAQSQYAPTPMMSPGPRSPSFRGPHAANFPPRTPGGSNPTAQSVARGDVGAAYGPYAYEHTHRSSESASSFPNGFRPSSEKFASPPPTTRQNSSVQSSLSPRRGKQFPDTTALPPYVYSQNEAEEDDALHRPDKIDQPFVCFSPRGWVNVFALVVLLGGLITLFVGFPVISHYRSHPYSGPGFNVGGINGSGQIPDLPNMPQMVDKDTPDEAKSRVGTDGQTYNLIFSDEFNLDGRSFYPGDDPYWEAQDMHYWATGDLEWYDPSAVTTADGSLVITMTKTPIHDLNYASGMLTSWNKFCFTTGYIEARVSLPGAGDVAGLWPGVWTMGNLGRPGYGATTEGTWPYSYDSCDVGTFPNQMDKSGNPASSLTNGWDGGQLSNLPGQKLSACSCPGSDHPGPKVSKGRGVPEIDILEAQVDRSLGQGEVSQSFQIAPFDPFVKFFNSSPATTISDSTLTHFNSFTGTNLQQSVSAVTYVDNANYNGSGYALYGLEYWSDPKNRDDGYVQWYSSGQESWKITSASIGPDEGSGVGQRLIPEEPLYLIMNLGMSPSFEGQDFQHLIFPSKMYIDYIRVYQRADVDPKDGIGCSPPNYPTAKYIEDHLNAYMNPNLTTWEGAGYTFPRNSKFDGC